MKKYALIVLLVIPFFASAHTGHQGLVAEIYEEDAGLLPGEVGYSFDRLGEWISVNLLTLSTKGKQEKILAVAEERVAEIIVLFELVPEKSSEAQKAADGYQTAIRSARDMVEKIIFLDGAEIALAERFELATREHERLLSELLEGEEGLGKSGIIFQALITARVENRQVFEYMVKNYQFNEDDIRKHQSIIDGHIGFVEEKRISPQITEILVEAREFQEAGLNTEAYDLVDKAKNLLYSSINSKSEIPNSK